MRYLLALESASNGSFYKKMGVFPSLGACDKEVKKMLAEGAWKDGQIVTATKIREDGSPIVAYSYNETPDSLNRVWEQTMESAEDEPPESCNTLDDFMRRWGTRGGSILVRECLSRLPITGNEALVENTEAMLTDLDSALEIESIADEIGPTLTIGGKEYKPLMAWYNEETDTFLKTPNGEKYKKSE